MKKIIKNEDLRNVNGGSILIDDPVPRCPKCGSYHYDSHSEGSGCDRVTHFKCKDCGTEWISH